MTYSMDDFYRQIEATNGIFSEFQRKIFADMGYGDDVTDAGYGTYFNPGERIRFTSDPRTDDNTNTKITTKEPREGYIDAGVIMAKGFIVTRKDYEECEPETWQRFRDWAESMDNIRVDELMRDSFIDQRLLWVYDVPPSITSLK